ncbi:hypothetical protein GCM10009823_14040 [Brevibacterium salitolerans]|uniref:Uncharacterized protein n=1 Tax=Brevibacterium salitolerans TaxID=1403566 RepID=A0ABN2WL86_9MICO
MIAATPPPHGPRRSSPLPPPSAAEAPLPRPHRRRSHPSPPAGGRRARALARISASLASLALAVGTAAFAAPAQAAPEPSDSLASDALAASEAPDGAAASSDMDTGTQGTPEASAAADEDENEPTGSVQVRIDSVSPWVDSDGALEVTGQVVNGTADPLAPESLTLSRSSQKISARTDIAAWTEDQDSPLLIASSEDTDGGDADGGDGTGASGEDGADESSGNRAGSPAYEAPELPSTLAPGDSHDFSFTVPADRMKPAGSAIDSWGALGLVVTLTAEQTQGAGGTDTPGQTDAPEPAEGAEQSDPAEQTTPATTPVQQTAPAFTVWHPDPGVDPTVVSTVLPVTLDAVPADGGPLLEAEVLERAADPSARGAFAGALDRSLTAARELDDAALAVDPRVLASARAALELPENEPEAPADDPTAEAPASAGQDGARTPGASPSDDGQSGDTPPADTPTESGAASLEGTDGPGAQEAEDEGAGDGQDDGTGDGPSADATEEAPDPEAAAARLPRLAEWYAEFTELAADREVLPLPWADAHVTALRSQASAAETSAEEQARSVRGRTASAAADEAAQLADGLGGLLDQADTERGLTGPLADSLRTDIMWPAADTVRRADLTALAEQGGQTLILSDAQQPSITSYTSSAYSTMDTHGDPQSAYAPPPDAEPGDRSEQGGGADGATRILNTLIADSGLSETAAEQARGRPRAPGEALATSAAITAERPFDSRHMLLTLPREAAGPDLPQLAKELSSAPWLSSESLDSLAETEPVARGALVEPSADQESAPGAQQAQNLLTDLGRSYGEGEAASAVFTDETEARRDMARSLLTCTGTERIEARRAGDSGDAPAGGTDTRADAGSGSETDSPSGTDACSERTRGWVAALAGGVRPEPGSSVLLVTGEQAHIPVRVENTTDRSARVRLRVEAGTPQLSTEESEPLTLGPGEARSVEVPVRGLANADVRAHVRVLSMDGTRMPQSTELLVRVRADWENTATLAVGTALALVLVFGLVRTIRRGRRKIPKSQLDAAVARAQS